MTSLERADRVQMLWRQRSRQPWFTWSAVGAGLAMIWVWTAGSISVGGLFAVNRRENLRRFASEVWPAERDGWAWLGEHWNARTWEATVATVDLAVVAAVLAASAGALVSLLAARSLMVPDPYLSAGSKEEDSQGLGWLWARRSVRGGLLLLRAIPEYLWAFLLVSILGLGPWPAVLALALHNIGILGRLYGELIEDVEPVVPRALAGLGAGRLQLAGIGLFPMSMNRGLLFFFTRWETCVREATVLGMLGFVSLGWLIQDSRARMHHDDMLFFVGLAALIVLVGDGLSIWLRRVVRGAGAGTMRYDPG